MKFKAGYIGLYLMVISICLLLASFSPQKKGVYNSKEILNGVLESISTIKTMRYNLQCNERIKGKMQHTESQVKLQISPRKLYLSVKGPEVLWLEGANDGDALVNPGAFPYMNLNLDPYGSLMRKDQHHTIHEMGLHYLAEILKDGIRRAGDKFDRYFVILGEEKYDGRDCYKLSIAFPDYSWNSYKVSNGENITSIARKLHVSEYMILEKNSEVAWFNDVKPGQIIQVPDAYAKLTILLIDKALLLPVNNKIFDDKGLFETYEYYNLQINPPIAAEEFTKEYKDYKF
ncbi:MAG: DUF1571 domain-containing protein [Bacteroidetes bacterium]|nr:DUF1571 domain-containing protein [Bacteroidota bacterium]